MGQPSNGLPLLFCKEADMGKVTTAIQFRKQRAVRLVLANAVTNDMPMYYWVKSQSQPGVRYRVMARFDWTEQPGVLLDARCDCPDWQNQLDAIDAAYEHGYSPTNPGISQVDGIPLCKHVLAVAYFTGALAWPEWAPAFTMELPVAVPA
jgi:hypothetical protein